MLIVCYHLLVYTYTAWNGKLENNRNGNQTGRNRRISWTTLCAEHLSRSGQNNNYICHIHYQLYYHKQIRTRLCYFNHEPPLIWTLTVDLMLPLITALSTSQHSCFRWPLPPAPPLLSPSAKTPSQLVPRRWKWKGLSEWSSTDHWKLSKYHRTQMPTFSWSLPLDPLWWSAGEEFSSKMDQSLMEYRSRPMRSSPYHLVQKLVKNRYDKINAIIYVFPWSLWIKDMYNACTH